ncbi:MAG: hypothetical protein AB3N13_01570 [Arenibacterium sp.]
MTGSRTLRPLGLVSGTGAYDPNPTLLAQSAPQSNFTKPVFRYVYEIQ